MRTFRRSSEAGRLRSDENVARFAGGRREVGGYPLRRTLAAFSIALIGALAPVHTAFGAPGKPVFSLRDRTFMASGAGEVKTTGSIAEGSSFVSIASFRSWREGHGIRIRRGGRSAPVDGADGGWVAYHPEATVVHDSVDRKEGTASVACSYVGDDPPPSPPIEVVDLCGVAFPPEDPNEPDTTARDLRSDETSFWLKANRSLAPRSLRLVSFQRNDDGTTTPIRNAFMDLPAISANQWVHVFLPTEGFTTLADEIRLQCRAQCRELRVHLDDFRIHDDLVAVVEQIQRRPKQAATFSLDRPAGTSVFGAEVFHDDTLAIQRWLRSADRPGGATLVVPPGTYYVGSVDIPATQQAVALPLFDDTDLLCDSRHRAVFRNSGGSRTGAKTMFRSASASPRNISVEDCVFDTNGWNGRDFLAVLLFSPPQPRTTAEIEPGTNIDILRNRFIDSRFPGTEDCELGAHPCETHQRLYVTVGRVDGLAVKENHLFGGRILATPFGLLRNVIIRGNVVEFSNDMGITLVDIEIGGECIVPCITENITIADNTIIDAVNIGIHFGSDGVTRDSEGLTLRNLAIERNDISGMFSVAGIFSPLPEIVEDLTIADNLIRPVRRIRPSSARRFAMGIGLLRGNVAMELGTLARRITVRDNRILVAPAADVTPENQAELNVAGIWIGPNMEDLFVSGNDVACFLCTADDQRVPAGLRLSSGRFDRARIVGNVFERASFGIRFGDLVPGEMDTVDLEIVDNEIFGSLVPFGGHITLGAFSGEHIQGKIVGNQLRDGLGYGIQCRGDGDFVLAGLSENEFSDNARADVSGCP